MRAEHCGNNIIYHYFLPSGYLEACAAEAAFWAGESGSMWHHVPMMRVIAERASCGTLAVAVLVMVMA